MDGGPLVVVGAPVVDEEETLHAHHPMELDPFPEKARFVLEDAANDEVGAAAPVDDGVAHEVRDVAGHAASP
jgi:hypothetical protein